MKRDYAERVSEHIADYLDSGNDLADTELWDSVARFASDHPAVARANFAIDAARRAGVRLVARDLEGLIAAELQRREAERVVAWLAKLLALVERPKHDVKALEAAIMESFRATFTPENLRALYVARDMWRAGWGDGESVQITNGATLNEPRQPTIAETASAFADPVETTTCAECGYVCDPREKVTSHQPWHTGTMFFCGWACCNAACERGALRVTRPAHGEHRIWVNGAGFPRVQVYDGSRWINVVGAEAQQ
jgi:hypothetical protein